MPEVTEEAVQKALHEVLDPELGINVVDLGLVYDVDVDEHGKVQVLMTMTTPGCPAMDYIRQDVEKRVGELPGVQEVRVQLTWSPPWSPDKMSDVAREQLRMH